MPTGEQIKAARKDLNESQAAFGSRFGVDQATIHRWESKGLPKRGTARVAVEKLLDELEREVAEETAQ
jgi:DNA-binding transcriptional regulator YiaG